MINSIVILLLVSGIGVLLLRRKIDLFQAYIFFVPYAQISVDVGLTLYFHQLILITLFCIVLINGKLIIQNQTFAYVVKL